MKREIIINEKNADRIRAELDELQKRCSARTIYFVNIADDCKTVERKLDLPKKYLKGVTIQVDHNAQDFPSAYKYTPESTHFTAVHTGKEWKLTDLRRDTTLRASKAFRVFLTEEAKAAILDRMSEFGRWG